MRNKTCKIDNSLSLVKIRSARIEATKEESTPGYSQIDLSISLGLANKFREIDRRLLLNIPIKPQKQ